MSLWLQPPKGTKDRFPEEFAVRKYIFDTWRKVCISFGYEEYLWPLVEYADIWRAKSGEDVWGSELTLITDREGKISDFALRPEMTPSVTRMVANKYRTVTKPIRWFSIANFYRNERPQRWRNREFRQLNVDMFGETSVQAELEILQMSLEIMFAFNVPEKSFVLKLNHRYLIDYFLLDIVQVSDEQKTTLIRLMDKWEKMERGVFIQAVKDQWMSLSQAEKIVSFLSSSDLHELISLFPRLEDNASIWQIKTLMEQLHQLGYSEWIVFSPSLMRGFDYYDGLVFEVFDNHPDNNRAMFGGGRYNGLASIFWSKEEIPAIGFAPGDEPMKLFLESWHLLPKIDVSPTNYIQVLDERFMLDAQKIAKILRSQWQSVEVSTTIKNVSKAIEYAKKKMIVSVIFIWEDEITKKQYVRKNIETWIEQIIPL